VSTALGTYQKFVIKGTGPGSEIWQTGFYTTCTMNPVDQPALQALLNTIAPFVDTFFAALKSKIYPTYTYTEVDAYQYVSPSHVAAFNAQAIRTPTAGTLVGNGQQLDGAVVCSIRTPLPSRRGRGRMYLPCHDVVQPSGMLANAATNTQYGTALKALFSSIVGGSVAAPIVVSRTGNFWNPPTQIITDNKPDVQRRRVDRLLPTSTQILAFP
jgi:hypothetical protein